MTRPSPVPIDKPPAASPQDPRSRAWGFLFSAWMLALLSSLAVLFVGEFMGQAPCNLCWFQRSFMFPLAIVLAVASWRADAEAWRYGLPLAVGGALVAGFHSLMYFKLIPERITPCSQDVPCTGADMSILGGLPLPLLSFTAFGAIAVLLIATRSRKQHP